MTLYRVGIHPNRLHNEDAEVGGASHNKGFQPTKSFVTPCAGYRARQKILQPTVRIEIANKRLHLTRPPVTPLACASGAPWPLCDLSLQVNELALASY